MHPLRFYILIFVVSVMGCQGIRYIPEEMDGVAIDKLVHIQKNKAGIFKSPDFMLSSIDGVRLASSYHGASPTIYLAPGAHEFVVLRKYYRRPYYNKGARIGDSVVTSPGYGVLKNQNRETRQGRLELDPGKDYTVQMLFDMLPRVKK